MEVKNFIISNLNSFITKFPQTRVRYEFIEDILTHYIEVVPNSIYHLDEAYIAWESDFYELFTTKFSNHNICFISDDALVGLDEIQFELVGASFIEYSVYNNCNCISLEEVNFNEQISISKITSYSVFDGLGSISVSPQSALTFKLSNNQDFANIFDVNGCNVNNAQSINEVYFPLAA
jgi:hypothetical protein